jgi:hypothetical protein
VRRRKWAEYVPELAGAGKWPSGEPARPDIWLCQQPANLPSLRVLRSHDHDEATGDKREASHSASVRPSS